MGKGKLRFKGEKETKKKKKKSKHSKQADATLITIGESITSTEQSSTVPPYPSIANPNPHRGVSAKPQNEVPEGPVIQKGQGLIMSSGTVIMGHDTQFNSTLNPGDAIVVHIPTADGDDDGDGDGTESTREEMRIVTIRLSDTSASISSAFSTDLRIPTPFHSIAKPRNQKKERMAKEKKDRVSKEETERSAFGTYRSTNESEGKDGKEFVYRESTENGGYRIRRETIRDDATRGDLLVMRAQKKVSSNVKRC
jgi:hypothetical protein